MKYIKIHNPHTEDVSTIFKGERVTIKAGATDKHPEDMVAFLAGIFGFLEVMGDDTAPKAEEIKEEVEKEEKKVPAKKVAKK